MLKSDLIKWTSQKNEHSRRAVLNYCRVEHKALKSKRHFQVIINVTNAKELLFLKRQNIVFVNLLFEFMNVPFLVLEHIF